MPTRSAQTIQNDLGTQTSADMTFSHTNPTDGSGDYIFVRTGSRSNNAPNADIVSVTYNALNLVEIWGIIGGAGYCHGWGWDEPTEGAPPTGANDIVVDRAATQVTHAVADSYDDVDSTTPLTTFVTDSGEASSLSVTVTTDGDEYVIDVKQHNADEVATPDGSQVEEFDNASAGDNCSVAGSFIADAGTPTQAMGWSWATTDGSCMGAVGINPAAVTGGPRGPLSHPLSGPLAGPIAA